MRHGRHIGDAGDQQEALMEVLESEGGKFETPGEGKAKSKKEPQRKTREQQETAKK